MVELVRGQVCRLDEPSYSLSDYKKIRRHNRELYPFDPEYLCSLQEDFTHNYDIKIGNEVYILSRWLTGIQRIRTHYGRKEIPTKGCTFADFFTLRRRLPSTITYIRQAKTLTNRVYEVKFLSKELMFTYTEAENGEEELNVIYGDIREVDQWL